MTDLEKFVQLYKEFGIDVYLEDSGDDGGKQGSKITLVGEHCDKIIGWGWTEILFDLDGKFIKQGFYD